MGARAPCAPSTSCWFVWTCCAFFSGYGQTVWLQLCLLDANLDQGHAFGPGIMGVHHLARPVGWMHQQGLWLQLDLVCQIAGFQDAQNGIQPLVHTLGGLELLVHLLHHFWWHMGSHCGLSRILLRFYWSCWFLDHCDISGC